MFQSFSLPKELLTALEKMKFTEPTPIQVKAIPPAMEGNDILGSAQTGTGKTAAFAIPIIVKLLATEHDQALILTPTRELATQVLDTFKKLLVDTDIETVLLIGGDSINLQLRQLRKNPRVIVGTPGRVFDHVSRKNSLLRDVTMFVLDEMDRMLDMGFARQIQQIARFLPEERQTMMFSATLPKPILEASKKYMQNPVRVSVGSTQAPANKITQDIIEVVEEGKYESLLDELDRRKGSVIIFVKTKRKADRLAKRLYSQNYEAEAIHGDLSQSRRERVILGFRNKKFRVLVATDVASRGLDIPHIEHVINYDLPQVPEDYIHRIGRTARAGESGHALSMVTPADRAQWRLIQRYTYPTSIAS